MAVTLRQIAAAAGVDKSTVSLALRGHPRISEATRERVRAAARRLGYRPDPALRRLSELRWAEQPSARSVSLALLGASRGDYPMQRERLLEPVRSSAHALGYGFEHAYFEDYPSSAALATVLRSRGVGGLILLPAREPYGLDGFPWSDFSVVKVLTGIFEGPRVPLIRPDPIDAALGAVTRLRESGCRSVVIQLLKQATPSETDLHYRAGVLLASRLLEEHGLKVHPVVELSPRDRPGLAAFGSWLERVRADALVSQNDALVHWLAGVGSRIPPGTGWITLTRGARTAGFERDFAGLAALAVERVDSLFRHGVRGAREQSETVLVRETWVDGEGWPPVRKS